MAEPKYFRLTQVEESIPASEAVKATPIVIVDHWGYPALIDWDTMRDYVSNSDFVTMDQLTTILRGYQEIEK